MLHKINEKKVIQKEEKKKAKKFVSLLKERIRFNRKEMKKYVKVKDYETASRSQLYMTATIDTLKDFKEIFGTKKKEKKIK